ncbi:MAG: carbon monoxide dehydrogenase accessory protein CooC [Chloroflexota bacterium]|nr:carbon monoxide dehydrogenase accessory protein CooC [Chloroflexota bacterium]
MKIAVAGKGGVGKTTLSSLLARVYAERGRPVLAVDANPDANLGLALGFSPQELERITPLVEMDKLIEERTGAKPGSRAPFFKINPKVDDIPERFSAQIDGIRLLVMGTVKTGGGGCLCPEETLLRALMSHLVLERSEVVIMDMEAGVEHLGRGTAEGVDAFIVVVEPGRRSLQTAAAVKRMASDLGVKRCYLVGNKVTGEADWQFILRENPGLEPLGYLGYHPQLREADLKGISALKLEGEVVAEVGRIVDRLEKG